jgi:hypothetical protein
MKYSLSDTVNDPACKKIKKMLKIIPSRINSLHFSECESLVTKATKACGALKEIGISNNDEMFVNSIYLVRIYCDMWGSISVFWKCAKEKKYENAWFNLQNAINRYDILSKNLINESELNTQGIGDYLLAYEQIFPYNLFLSMGFSSISHCSICKLSSFDSSCRHMPGEIYWGELARIEHEVTEIYDVSIVESPENKHCVIKKDDSFFSNLQEVFDFVKLPLNKLIIYSDRNHVDVDLENCISIFN